MGDYLQRWGFAFKTSQDGLSMKKKVDEWINTTYP
jgi:hypothetical protein